MNYYEILGVDIDSTYTEINRAYRTLSLKYQPDKNLYEDGFYERKFKEIAEAYAVLGNEEQKLAYDIACGFVIIEKEKEEIVVEKVVLKPQKQVKQIKPEINNHIPKDKVVAIKRESSRLVYLFAILFIGIGIYIFNNHSEVDNNNFEENSLPIVSPEPGNESTASNDSSYFPESCSDFLDNNEVENLEDDYLTEEEVNRLVAEVEELEEKEILKNSAEVRAVSFNNDDTSDTDAAAVPSYFSLGSSKSEVIKAQGKPISVDYFDGKEIWFFGEHRVVLKNGKVVDYVDPYDQLNVR